VRAYDAARRGDALELSPVPVVVHGWQVLSWRAPFLDARITCAGGTYVRALARDLGRLTSSAAHLTALRRARSGSFDVADALSFDTLREGSRPPLSPLAAIPSLPTERLTPDESARVRRGQRLPATGEAPRAALLDDGGALVAIAERDSGEWQPRVVFGDD
jgi:tRNA pseudouridine55 synthase